MKISRYKTVSGTHGKLVDDVVNELIEQGYQPYGNPYTSQRQIDETKTQFIISQAMVLTDIWQPPDI